MPGSCGLPRISVRTLQKQTKHMRPWTLLLWSIVSLRIHATSSQSSSLLWQPKPATEWRQLLNQCAGYDPQNAGPTRWSGVPGGDTRGRPRERGNAPVPVSRLARQIYNTRRDVKSRRDTPSLTRGDWEEEDFWGGIRKMALLTFASTAVPVGHWKGGRLFLSWRSTSDAISIEW